jgi:hypothetical protein
VANRLRLRLTGFDELRHAVKAYGKHVVADAVDAVSDAVEDTVATASPRAHLVEFGSARITKKPFLVPAAIRNRKRLNQDLVAAVVRRAPDGLGTPKISGEGPGTPGIGID